MGKREVVYAKGRHIIIKKSENLYTTEKILGNLSIPILINRSSFEEAFEALEKYLGNVAERKKIIQKHRRS